MKTKCKSCGKKREVFYYDLDKKGWLCGACADEKEAGLDEMVAEILARHLDDDMPCNAVLED